MVGKRMVAATVCCMAMVGGTAQAAGTQREVVEDSVVPYEFAIDCSEWGDYDFDNQVEGTQRFHVTEVRDAQGTLLRTVVNTTFTETDTNADSGKVLKLKGAYHEVLDWTTFVRTLDGNVAFGTQPGKGSFLHETGRITINLDNGEALTVAGPHPAYFQGGIDVPVCAALAGA